MDYFIDDYDHADDNVEYILESVLSEEMVGNTKLKEDFNTTLLNTCECEACDTCSSCHHGINYMYDAKSGELIIHPLHMSDLIYECTSRCKCKVEHCQNRLVQYGPRKNLKIIYSHKYKSKGVMTRVDIPEGAFICEYAGEILTRNQARQRICRNEKNHEMNYVLCLKENLLMENNKRNDNEGDLITIVDPSKRGNIGRYLNHSCQPNCQIFSVRIDCPIPKIAVFSKRAIEAGEELCFHYNEGTKTTGVSGCGKSIPCLCNNVGCELFLPNLEI